MRSIGVKLTADTTGYISGLARAKAATQDFTGQMDRAAKTGHLDRVADQASKFGLVGVAAFGMVVKSAADFDKQMSAVSAATHAGTEDMAALRAAALQAGKDTQYSATEAAKGITELSKAGVSTAQILGGGLKGALALAAAGQLDVGEASETAASAMTQFNLTGDKVPHIADLLAAAAGKAQGSVHDMGYALSQSGLVASQMGLSIEDTTGTLAAFASAGLLGSDAGTSFKTMLLALQNPTAKTAGMMRELGLSAYDAKGNFVGITNFAGQLQEKLSKLTPEMRQQTLAQIFGNDAVRAGTILYTQGAKGLQTWIDKTNDAGYASSTAAKLTDNLAGDLERLKGSLETMAIEAGSGANGGLRLLTKGVGSLVDQFSQLPPAVGSGLTILAGVGGVAALALVGFIKLRKGLAEAVEQLNAMGPSGERAAGALEKTAGIAAKVAAAFAVLEVVGAVADHFGAAAVNADKMAASLTHLSQTGKSAGEITDVFGKNLEDFASTAQTADAATHGFWGGLNDLISGVPGVGKVVDKLNESIYGLSFNRATEDMAGLDQALVEFMTTTNDAARSNELFNQLLLKSGMDVDQFAKLVPNAYKKIGELNNAADQGTGAMGDLSGATAESGTQAKKYANAADMAAGAARGERDALKDLATQMKSELSPVFGLLDAESSLTKAQKDATKAIKEHGRSSDEAKAATRNLASAAVDLQGKAAALGATFDGKMTPALRKTLHEAGLTEDQIKDVAKQFRQAKTDADKYDGSYAAHVSVTGVPKVKASLEDLLVAQDALKKGIPISAAQSAFNKNAFAEGGFTGPGPKYQEAGVVHAGEYVFNAQATANMGVGRLDQMHKSAQVPGYADGGVVWPYPTNAAMTRIPSRAQAMAAITPSFGSWPSSPSAQRGDSGVWRSILTMIRAAGIPYVFGNGYRKGDRLWHGSGRADDLMGYNQDELATFLAGKQPLELIHRTAKRDYAYTRGVNKGSFNNSLMEAHRNHVHIAMQNGGVIREPVIGVGASGASYSFAERGPETVRPGVWAPAGGGGRGSVVVNVQAGYVVSEQQLQDKITSTIDDMKRRGRF